MSEKKNNSNNAGIVHQQKCAYCGKKFMVLSGEWAYKRNGKFFCTWGCLRKKYPEPSRLYGERKVKQL